METWWEKESEKEQAIGQPGEYRVPEASKREGRSGGPKAAKIASQQDWKLTIGLTTCAPGGTFTRAEISIHNSFRKFSCGKERNETDYKETLLFCVFFFLGGKDFKMFKTFWKGSS